MEYAQNKEITKCSSKVEELNTQLSQVIDNAKANLNNLELNMNKIYKNELESQQFQLNIIQKDREKFILEHDNVKKIDQKRKEIIEGEVQFENDNLDSKYQE